MLLDSSSSAPLVLIPQLLFKPKTAKTATPTPVLVLSLDSSDYSSSALGKVLNLKELRLASDDLLQSTLGTANKDDASPLSIAGPAPETLHIVVDAAIAKAPLVALHGETSATTLVMKGEDVETYVKGLKGEGEVKVLDFAELKAQPAPEGDKDKKVAAPIA